MNSLSFGFLATAILILMFLFMAIFEHLFRSRASHTSSPLDDAIRINASLLLAIHFMKQVNFTPFDSLRRSQNRFRLLQEASSIAVDFLISVDARAAISNIPCSTSSSAMPKGRSPLAFSSSAFL
ncbi:hypothetical protein ZIOFF_002992 [Zingiber officinale]|uniref:Uncharacterized protein n=1 Tax=Zingiber officinale TaxID=94328 RepID=A0A8J5IMH6_ZINOF|nr:hypothetical protein ZIOFF_033654 [Zingiber officinale]KAG6537889.1 hypothetical protein ZIOFF_002992 [Zingiber officinale]